MYISVPNFNEIGLTILSYHNFSGWRPSAILGLFSVYLDHPRRVLGDLYCCASLVAVDAVVLKVRKFQYFAVGLKMLIHSPKIGVLEQFG